MTGAKKNELVMESLLLPPTLIGFSYGTFWPKTLLDLKIKLGNIFENDCVSSSTTLFVCLTLLLESLQVVHLLCDRVQERN